MRATAGLTLLFFFYAFAPGVARAQITSTPMTTPPDLPSLQLFREDSPTSIGKWTLSLSSADFGKPPVNGSEVPRWMIRRTAVLNGPAGLALSAGFSGRRGDAMPLYLSRPELMQTAAENSITGPGTYRTQWDVTFGVSASVMTVRGVKLSGFSELIVPVTTRDSGDSATPPILNSRTIRFGIMAAF
jgi:hypothetical protein